MRAVHVLCAVVASAVLAGCADDLRARVEAAGVFTPARTTGSQPGLVELGQALFFDRELSGGRDVACASCHLPFLHANDARVLGQGVGATGEGLERDGGHALPRHTIAPFNRSFASSLLWDGRVERLDDGTLRAPVPLPDGIRTPLEAQALLPLLDRAEMRGWGEDELGALSDDDPTAVWDAVMARIMAIEGYRTMFAAAFPGTAPEALTIVHVARAIVRFEMQLWELTDTRFDQWLGADHRLPVDDVLQDQERRGADLFFGDAGCARCHDGPLLSDGGYHNVGLPPSGPGFDGTPDEGRARVTGDPRDRFAFRTPPLRSVHLTAPYFHDGSVELLIDAIRQHLEPERALAGVDPDTAQAVSETLDPALRPLRELSDDEVWAIVAFLETLTSQTESSVFPGAGEPAEVPSGLPVDHADPSFFEIPGRP